jgi:hypothetical protein
MILCGRVQAQFSSRMLADWVAASGRQWRIFIVDEFGFQVLRGKV